jgi:hypothetical protein
MAKKESPNLEELRTWVESHYVTKQQINSLTRRLNDSKERLKGLVQHLGDKNPESGSIYLNLGAPVTDKKILWLKNQRAVSQTINMDAAERILKKKNLWGQMTTTVEVLDEAKVRAAYYDRKLTEGDLDQIFPQHISYSFILLDNNEKPVS